MTVLISVGFLVAGVVLDACYSVLLVLLIVIVIVIGALSITFASHFLHNLVIFKLYLTRFGPFPI